MPAMLDDPTAPAIYRRSGERPYPTPHAALPSDIKPRRVTLRDRITVASLIPFSSPSQVPASLILYLCGQLNKEIEKGDTYPMIDGMVPEAFGPYWFANFGAVMLLGDVNADGVRRLDTPGRDWEKECLGSFYIKPNYPGRSSHVCNGGFLVTDGARNRGVGRLMGETYLEWAPKLGYNYSVFNLVYETNVASCRIWDALGFKRIGRVPGCGNLKSYPDRLVDALIYGRDLQEETVAGADEERFEKIRYYLKNGTYPAGADRQEKGRLRSAATHYKLVAATATEPEKLMLKGKEVISDPSKQYQIAKDIHSTHHGGINKTTATIAEKYHWIGIKETSNTVIKHCDRCKDPTRNNGALLQQQQQQQLQQMPQTPPLSLQPNIIPGNYVAPYASPYGKRKYQSPHYPPRPAPGPPTPTYNPYAFMQPMLPSSNQYSGGFQYQFPAEPTTNNPVTIAMQNAMAIIPTSHAPPYGYTYPNPYPHLQPSPHSTVNSNLITALNSSTTTVQSSSTATSTTPAFVPQSSCTGREPDPNEPPSTGNTPVALSPQKSQVHPIPTEDQLLLDGFHELAQENIPSVVPEDANDDTHEGSLEIVVNANSTNEEAAPLGGTESPKKVQHPAPSKVPDTREDILAIEPIKKRRGRPPKSSTSASQTKPQNKTEPRQKRGMRLRSSGAALDLANLDLTSKSASANRGTDGTKDDETSHTDRHEMELQQQLLSAVESLV